MLTAQVHKRLQGTFKALIEKDGGHIKGLSRKPARQYFCDQVSSVSRDAVMPAHVFLSIREVGRRSLIQSKSATRFETLEEDEQCEVESHEETSPARMMPLQQEPNA